MTWEEYENSDWYNEIGYHACAYDDYYDDDY